MTTAAVGRVPMGASHAIGVSVPLSDLLAIVHEYIGAGRFGAAERLLAYALVGSPNQAEALHLRGFIAFRQGRMGDAAKLMEAALAAGANLPRQLCSLAEVYRILGRLDAGISLARQASAVAPTDPTPHFTEAMLRFDRQELDLCIRAARRAIALKLDMAEAHMRLGQALLLAGAFAEGWEEYEWRYRIAEAPPLIPAELSRRAGHVQWDGGTLGAGQPLLVVADQGFGDVLMFCRFLPWAMARCADIAVACSVEVVALLRRVYPGPRYFTQWNEAPDYAAFCPLSGLPRLAAVTVDAVDGKPPYIAPDPARRAAMLEWLEAATPREALRVGLAWAGRPSHHNDRNRSLRLDALAALTTIPGVAFVSLQKGAAGAQLGHAATAASILDASARLRDFEDAAALVDCLDLVVAVDTAVVHLAGALGKPVWAMLPFAPDWRWLSGRRVSLWYASCELYRQPAPGDWDSVVASVADDLSELARAARSLAARRSQPPSASRAEMLKHPL